MRPPCAKCLLFVTLITGTLQDSFISPLDRSGNRGSERFSNLSKVIQLVIGAGRPQTLASDSHVQRTLLVFTLQNIMQELSFSQGQAGPWCPVCGTPKCLLLWRRSRPVGVDVILTGLTGVRVHTGSVLEGEGLPQQDIWIASGHESEVVQHVGFEIRLWR